MPRYQAGVPVASTSILSIGLRISTALTFIALAASRAFSQASRGFDHPPLLTPPPNASVYQPPSLRARWATKSLCASALRRSERPFNSVWTPARVSVALRFETLLRGRKTPRIARARVAASLVDEVLPTTLATWASA
jgi:hypothetical protein